MSVLRHASLNNRSVLANAIIHLRPPWHHRDIFAVCEGSEHAYGVDLPERERPESRQIANWVELTLQES
jgi:hypothetical protein